MEHMIIQLNTNSVNLVRRNMHWAVEIVTSPKATYSKSMRSGRVNVDKWQRTDEIASM